MRRPSPVFPLVATALLAWAALAFADPAAVERCRTIDDLEERVACLEAALAEAETVTPDTPAADEPAAEAPPTPPAVEAEPVAPAPAAVSSPVTTELPPEEPGVRDQLTVPVPAETETPDAPAAAETEAAPETGSDTGIGAEQLERPSGKVELARATGLEVERYDEVPFRRLVVYLENGQVWRQIKGDTQTIRATRDRNQTVDIEESALGGYRLRLNEMRRTIRVERVR